MDQRIPAPRTTNSERPVRREPRTGHDLTTTEHPSCQRRGPVSYFMRARRGPRAAGAASGRGVSVWVRAVASSGARQGGVWRAARYS